MNKNILTLFALTAGLMFSTGDAFSQHKIKKEPYKKMGEPLGKRLKLFKEKSKEICLFEHTFERETADGKIKSVTINKAYNDLPDDVYVLYQRHMEYYVFNEKAFKYSSTNIKEDYKEAEKIFRDHIIDNKNNDRYKARDSNLYMIIRNKSGMFKEFYVPQEDVASYLGNYFYNKNNSKNKNVGFKKQI